ncbi:MFS transporter [Geobacillus sp. 44C]|nr:MFS transporter [Geobacillus sp. 44C]
MNYQRFVAAQSFVMTAGSIVFPFYLLFIRNIGDSYSQFGLAYGLFALTAALSHVWIGKLTDRYGDRIMLLVYAWGMAGLMLLIPISTEIWQIYFIQIVMGLLGAVQKRQKRPAFPDSLNSPPPEKTIGYYHFWTSIWPAIAVIATGYLIDFLTIGSLFYFASLLYMAAALKLASTVNRN